MFLLDLHREFTKRKVRYCVVGGYAVSLHGAVRGTLDIDILLPFDLKQHKRAEEALESLGLKSRLPIIAKDICSFRKEYNLNRNLVAWSFVGQKDPSKIIDIIITHDLNKVRAEKIKIKGLSIPVISIDDLIEMKETAGREQDVSDVSALKRIKESRR